MIKIAIIDDEEEILERIRNKIEGVENLADIIDVDVYTEAEHVLNSLEKGIEYDIIFSDIDMKNMTGIEFGKIVRSKYPNIFLVFLTSYLEYAVQSYSMNAYQYILKSDMDLRLPKVLQQLVNQICQSRQQYRILKVNNDIRKIFYKDIIYIKKMKSAKYIQYCTVKGEYRERITLEKVLQELNDIDFIMVERGYIVNIKYIVRVNGNTIYLENGDEVIISRARLNEVKEQISFRWRSKNEHVN